MKRRYLIGLLLIIILSTYSIKGNFSGLPILVIKEIYVENNSVLDKNTITKKLNFLLNKNIILIDKKEIQNKLEEIDIIKSFEIKKVYPNKIKIKIFEKKPIAILQNKTEKKYFTENNDIISFFNFKNFEDLPLVFGDEANFGVFYNSLKKINFPIENIKEFYLFESKRWDLVTKKNQLIKLPTNDYLKSLENFLVLKDQVNFDKYRTFDYRISDQLILK